METGVGSVTRVIHSFEDSFTCQEDFVPESNVEDERLKAWEVRGHAEVCHRPSHGVLLQTGLLYRGPAGRHTAPAGTVAPSGVGGGLPEALEVARLRCGQVCVSSTGLHSKLLPRAYHLGRLILRA